MIKTVLNAAALLIGLTGIFFKGNHWAGADMLILTGFILLLVSAAAFTVGENKAAGLPALLNYVMVATLVIGILGVIFKAMNWPGAFILNVSTGLLLVVLSVALLATRTITASRQFVTVFVIWFALVAALLNINYMRRSAAPVAETAAAPVQP